MGQELVLKQIFLLQPEEHGLARPHLCWHFPCPGEWQQGLGGRLQGNTSLVFVDGLLTLVRGPKSKQVLFSLPQLCLQF